MSSEDESVADAGLLSAASGVSAADTEAAPQVTRLKTMAVSKVEDNSFFFISFLLWKFHLFYISKDSYTSVMDFHGILSQFP